MKRLVYLLIILLGNILSLKAANIDISCQFDNGICGGHEGLHNGYTYYSTGYILRNSNDQAIYGVSGASNDAYLALFYEIVTSTKSTNNEVAIDYALNLENVSGYSMAFWYILTDHSHYSGTGIFMSDDGGSSFTKIFDFDRDEEVWHPVMLDIDSLATQNGLSLNNQVVLRIKYAFDVYPDLGSGIGIDNLVFGDTSCNSNDISINQSSMPQLGGEFLNGWYGTNGNITVSNTTILNGTRVITQSGDNSNISLEPGFICESGSSFKASADYSCELSLKSAKISDGNMLGDKPKNLKIDIFPNPSTGNLILKPNMKFGLCKIQIADIQGQMIEEFEKTINSNSSLNLTNLPPGLYLIKIKTEMGISTQKIIIK